MSDSQTPITNSVTPVIPTRVVTTTTTRSTSVPQAQHHGGVISNIGGFLVWLFTGFGLFSSLGKGRKSDEIVLYCVPRSFFLWLVILVGFIGAVWVHNIDSAKYAWGWVYLATVVFTIFTLVFDIGIISLLVWTGVFVFMFVLSAYLATRNIDFLSRLAKYLGGLHPQLDPGFASAMSWVLLLPWLGSMFQAFVKGRKIFTPNSIEERVIGQGVEVTDRSGLRFRARYRDLQETLLGLGAGDLEATDQHQNVVKRWENVLFLAFTWSRLDSILQQRATTVENTVDKPVEVETIRR